MGASETSPERRRASVRRRILGCMAVGIALDRPRRRGARRDGRPGAAGARCRDRDGEPGLHRDRRRFGACAVHQRHGPARRRSARPRGTRRATTPRATPRDRDAGLQVGDVPVVPQQPRLPREGLGRRLRMDGDGHGREHQGHGVPRLRSGHTVVLARHRRQWWRRRVHAGRRPVRPAVQHLSRDRGRPGDVPGLRRGLPGLAPRAAPRRRGAMRRIRTSSTRANTTRCSWSGIRRRTPMSCPGRPPPARRTAPHAPTTWSTSRAIRRTRPSGRP